MNADALTELLAIRSGLEVRLSLLRPDLYQYFLKDKERLDRLIESLQLKEEGSE